MRRVTAVLWPRRLRLAASIAGARRAAIVCRQPAGRGRAGAPGHGEVLRGGGAVRRPALARPVQPSAAQGALPAGAGRWIDDRVWLYDFREALPPGVRCAREGPRRVEAARRRERPGRSEAADRADASSRFSTGGPAVVSMQPWRRRADRGGPALPAHAQRPGGRGHRARRTPGARSKASASGCRVVVVGGRLRDALLKARRIDAGACRADAARCAAPRPLPPTMPRVRLVWGKGIAAAGNPQVRHHDRAALTATRCARPSRAEFSCERETRERAVPADPADECCGSRRRWRAKSAEQVRAARRPTGAPLAPVFDKDDKADEVSEVAFAAPLAGERGVHASSCRASSRTTPAGRSPTPRASR